VQRCQESGETCLPQILDEDGRTVQQAFTLCKDSRGLFRSDAADFLSIPSAISGFGIRHIDPSFAATWVVPGCAATRAARVVDGTL
jgi:hypothetical protein